ncbi:MAG: heme-dependent peroxidase [Planctomycetales bacterium]|nr:heme-dependent peroxidase [Planctomycetales bacterium]
MNRPQHAAEPEPISLSPAEGWHCLHVYYQFDRAIVKAFDQATLHSGIDQLQAILNGQAEGAPQRVQTSLVSGHKADFGLMLMDPNPLVIDTIHQRLLASDLGPALRPTYSFVSVTEVSEYVPTIEQYAARLVHEGETPGSDSYNAKVARYEAREPMMRKQRLTPDFPEWPATCFYPMNKKRKVGENWFTMPFSERNRLMAEHARSGMEFAGKVSQLITVAVGLDDWEWGVTLWARNPAFLKDIVYRMRFDEASARYAEFGPFYTSYVCTPAEMLKHCHIG